MPRSSCSAPQTSISGPTQIQWVGAPLDLPASSLAATTKSNCLRGSAMIRAGAWVISIVAGEVSEARDIIIIIIFIKNN